MNTDAFVALGCAAREHLVDYAQEAAEANETVPELVLAAVLMGASAELMDRGEDELLDGTLDAVLLHIEDALAKRTLH
jgi:hypothetical protein